MNKIPFAKFIITLLFCGKTINEIIDKLKTFNYDITEPEISEIFNDIKAVLPKNIIELLNNRQILNVLESTHVQWLQHFEIFEIYDYIIRSPKQIENPPNYFKWCEDCIWIHTYPDIMSLVNIFLFNGEEIESISDILMVKYNKKVGIEALKLYEKIFWNVSGISAKEALKYCITFRNNALIIRQFKSGDSEIEMNNEMHDGCDVPFNFHDSNYIKWKIGYKVEAPTPKDFLQKVQTDSMFKYYEAMNMAQSIEIEEEQGENDRFGVFDGTKTKKRNVEEMKAKIAKQWFDMYLKAKEHMPTEGKDTESFFEKMRQLELDFDECDEQIAEIKDMPDVMDDIKGDMAV